MQKKYSSTYRLYCNKTAMHVNCNDNYTIINEKCVDDGLFTLNQNYNTNSRLIKLTHVYVKN